MELTDAELALFYNGEAEPVWSAPLDAAVDLWKEQGYVQTFVPGGAGGAQSPWPPARPWWRAVRITDDHGQDFWYLLGGWRNQRRRSVLRLLRTASTGQYRGLAARRAAPSQIRIDVTSAKQRPEL